MNPVRRFALGVGGVVGVPIYLGLESVVRVANLGRSRPLTDAELGVVGDARSVPDETARELLGLVSLPSVRVVAPARLPTSHRGITLGRTIFVKGALDMDKAGDRKLLVHELAHVAQRERAGRVGMAWEYSTLYADGFSYRDHAMEVEARAVADATVR